LQKASWRRMWI